MTETMTATAKQQTQGEQQVGHRWSQLQVRAWAPVLALSVAFFLQWSLLMNVLGPTWDAAFYYAYARSLVFDQDVAIENDLLLSYPSASPDFVARELHANKTETGSVYAPFAIGSALLWAPLLATVHLVATTVGVTSPTGFEWYFVGPVATFSALAGFISFALAYRVARREADPHSALLATLAMTFATPLVYYQFREPLYAHVPSALLNTLVLVVWWRCYRQLPSWRQGVIMGALLALAALMRWQNVIYLILPLTSTVWSWLKYPPSERRARRWRFVLYLLALGATFLLVFSPQFFVWKSHYGSWLTVPQGDDFMSWHSPFLRETLLSSFRGLMPWMPVFGLAAAGLVLQARKNARLVLPLLILLLVSTYINASSRDWFAGGGYGPRRFVGELAILVLGYSWLLHSVSAKIRWPLGLFAGVTLLLHQWLLLRFALAERIGGRVVSMAPNFEWAEVPFTTFIGQLAAHLPDLVRTPRDVFVFPASPLGHWLTTRRLPVEHLISLAAAALFLATCLWLSRLLVVALRSRHI